MTPKDYKKLIEENDGKLFQHYIKLFGLEYTLSYWYFEDKICLNEYIKAYEQFF